jgi:hypothetical protein
MHMSFRATARTARAAMAGAAPWAVCAAVAAVLASTAAAAATQADRGGPRGMTYHFFTLGPAHGDGPVASFADGAQVAGLFMHVRRGPPADEASRTADGVRGRAIASLVGRVGELAFSDPYGPATLGQPGAALRGSFAGRASRLELAAEPTGSGERNLSGFDIAGWRLVNVRMTWDLPGAAGQPLPIGKLPRAEGTLALDFAALGGSAGDLATVTFDQLRVRPVPEPATWALWAAGALGLGVAVRRRRRADG